MATHDVLETNSRAIPEPLGDGYLWLDDAYTYEPLSWGSTIDDKGFAPRSWEETGFEELQRTDSVPTTISRPGVASPEVAHPSSIDAYAGRGGILTQRQSPYATTLKTDNKHPTALSILPDQERRNDDEVQRLICSECGLDFENLQGLSKHTMSLQHRAWRCQEDGCGKTYVRRDTFLRHRTKHMTAVHACSVCSRSNKHKVFKRKDHLKEHMRNCHSRSVDGIKSSPDILSFDKLVNNITFESMSECGISTAPSVGEGCSSQQQEAMKDLVRSLGTVLGDRHPNLMEKLENKMTAMSSSDMEAVAENMAGAALAAKTYLTAAKSCGCHCTSSSRSEHSC